MCKKRHNHKPSHSEERAVANGNNGNGNGNGLSPGGPESSDDSTVSHVNEDVERICLSSECSDSDNVSMENE